MGASFGPGSRPSDGTSLYGEFPPDGFDPSREQRLWVNCDCRHPEHQFILSYWPDETNPPFLYLEVHLARQSFWRRLRYLFGHQCKYGAFQESILTDQHAAEIEDFLFRFRNRDSDTYSKSRDAKQGSVGEADGGAVREAQSPKG